MGIAFGTFNEPHAWLIRGLVEYGWSDTSRAGGYVPPGQFGGMDLSRFAETEGREGIVLDVPAVIQGQRFDDDGTYHFQAQVIRSSETGQLAVAVRCPEANYIQEFAWDPQNPTWVAGFVHQALTRYVPSFIHWRQQGGSVTWAQRQGIVELEGEPCSGPLSGFIAESIRAGRAMDRGPAEGWWMGAGSPLSTPGGSVSRGPTVPGLLRQGSAPPVLPTGAMPQPPAGGNAPVAVATASGPVASTGGPVVPGIIAGGPIASAGSGMGGARGQALQARMLAEKPGTALMVTSGLGVLQGLFWFFNALSILIWYRESMGALAISVFGAMVFVPIGAVAGFGAWKYRQGERHPLGWVAIGYAAVVPVCCIVGIPIAGWAAKTWMDPVFKKA